MFDVLPDLTKIEMCFLDTTELEGRSFKLCMN